MRNTTKALHNVLRQAQEADAKLVDKLKALISWTENAERHCDEQRRALSAEIDRYFAGFTEETRNLRVELDTIIKELEGPAGKVPVALVTNAHEAG